LGGGIQFDLNSNFKLIQMKFKSFQTLTGSKRTFPG
jgi:hypothetical protein